MSPKPEIPHSQQALSNTCAEEAIGSIRTVRSFANEDGELCDYSSELHDMLQVMSLDSTFWMI